MIEGVSIRLREPTESSVRVTLAPISDAVDLEGTWELYGPRCEYARTLASTFRGSATERGAVEFLVTEPCYWSPELPFLYELRRVDAASDGRVHTLGLRNLSVHGPNLRLGGKRVVLRGAATLMLSDQETQEAHAAEAAIVLRSVDDATLVAASRRGVFTLVDATAIAGALAHVIARLSWRPAAAVVLLRGDQLEGVSARGMECPLLVAQRFDSSNVTDTDAIAADCNVAVAIVERGKRPPRWMSTCGRPVVAVRRGATYADFVEARAGCDRLQADLAPEFDLAGYFVAR